MWNEVAIECDDCGRAFFGPDLELVVRRVGNAILCVECQRKLTRTNDTAHRMASPRKRSGRRATAAASLLGA